MRPKREKLQRIVTRVALLATLPLGAAAQAVRVEAYNTYGVPPFVVSAGRGLDVEVVAYLNRKLEGAYRLELSVLPRERLLKRHMQPPRAFEGISLFMAPAFVEDQADQFLWSPPLFDDQNMLIFPAERGVRAQRFEDLKGLRFGGVLGYRYERLDDMVAAGTLSKENAGSALASLRQVCLGRVDFTQMSRVMFDALSPDSGCAGRLVTQAVPGSAPFGRRILIGLTQVDLAERIGSAVEQMPCDRQWRRVAASHRLAVPACKGTLR